MTQTVADFVLERLRHWGVEVVFGYAGDGINGLLAAWGRADNQPTFVQSRHEEMSAFEAVGYAKFSGRVAVCVATSGPGAIHLLNGLYDAKLDHVPVVAIVGQTSRSAMGGSYQQEVDLLSLFKDVASDYLQMVTVPEQLPNVLDRAVRIAEARQAPTCIILPADVQELEYVPPPHEFKFVPSSPAATGRPELVPVDADLARAAEVLNAGGKVAMLVGQGARAARAEVLEVADLLGAGVAKALLGKDVLSDERTAPVPGPSDGSRSSQPAPVPERWRCGGQHQLLLGHARRQSHDKVQPPDHAHRRLRGSVGRQRADQVLPTGGVAPLQHPQVAVVRAGGHQVSRRGVAYVRNAGTPMCTGLGPQPSITGFTFDAEGQLTPIPGSTRPLSGLPNSGCTQVAFDRTGNVVIVEEQQTDVITTYTQKYDGLLPTPTAVQALRRPTFPTQRPLRKRRARPG